MARPFFPWVRGRYFSAKNTEKLIPYIRRIMPEKISQYLEPFGGSGAMLLSLEPAANRLDIYNDYNADLVNLFLCVKERSGVLFRELRFFPFHSRAEFEWYRDVLSHKEAFLRNIEEELNVLKDRTLFREEEAKELTEILIERTELFDVWRAAAYFKRIWGSFSGTTNSFGIKAFPFERAIRRAEQAVTRLQDIVIENKDAVKIITEEDKPNGLIYCDPPYYKAEQHYDAAFPKRGHRRLWKALRACSGFVIVSYNDCPYIRNLYKDFYIIAFERQNPMAKRAGARYGELLITNYDPRPCISQLTLFDEPSELGEMKLIRIPRTPLKQQ